MNIVIPGNVKNGRWGVSATYMEYFSMFGDVSVFPNVDASTAERLLSSTGPEVDLVVLPGGPDVLPHTYGNVPGYATRSADPHLEYFDQNILPTVLGMGIPVFGICRGFQVLAVAMGGTLIQDLPHHPMSTPRTQLVHKVTTADNKTFKVNSLHHQGASGLAPCLRCLVTSEDNLVEAFRHDRLPIAAVQWHPEEINDNFTGALVRSILK